MIDEQLFYNLKEQVQVIEDSYITLDDIKGKYLTPNNLNDYITKSEIENTYFTIQEGLKISEDVISLSERVDNIDLSIFITENNLNEFVSSASKDILDKVNKTISDMDVYTKNEIDNKFQNININLDNYITIDKLTSYGYISESEFELLLNSKNFLTEHQSLAEYVKNDKLEDIINNKLDGEFNSLKHFYDTKLDELRDVYMSTLNERGYVTNNDVIEIISNSLFNYINDSRLENILNDYANKVYIHDYVETKISKLNFIKPEDLDNFSTNVDIPTKVSELLNDKGYITEHQSLSAYVKKSELESKLRNNYVDKYEFEEIIKSLSTISNDFLKLNDLTDYAKKSEIPNKVSQLVNDKGYITEHQSLSAYVKKSELDDYVNISKFDNKISDIFETISNLNTSEIDLTDYAKKSEIPTKVSQLVNDKGYITKHQPLTAYAKKSELLDYMSKSEFKEYMYSNGLLDTNIFVLRDELKKYASVSNIPTKISQLVNDKGYITEHQSLSAYVKKSELDDYVTVNELEKVISSLESNETPNGITFDDLTDYAKKSEIPTKISQLVNDKGFITKHQSLTAYVKKSELDDYVTVGDFNVIKNEVSSIKNDDFLTKNDLSNYITQDYAKDMFLYKSDKPNMSFYAKKEDLTSYVKISSLPDFNDYVKVDDIPNLKDYLKVSDINSFGFAKLIDIPDTSNFVKLSNLSSYVKGSEFDRYKKQIESRQYQTKQDINDTLGLYVKKSEINLENYVDIKTIQEMISEKINSIHIPNRISELINDSGYITNLPKLSGYVKRSDISDFITIYDADDRYIKINDFSLPLDIVYKKDLKEYSKTSDILNLKESINSKLNNYELKTDFDKNISIFEKTVDEKLSNLEKIVFDTINNFELNINLNDYVKRVEVDNFLNNIDGKFATISSVNSKIFDLSEKINKQKIWINETFVKKSDNENVGDLPPTHVSDIDYDSFLNDYYTKTEAHLKFLSKEDYRGIKTAATINFAYNDYPDLFFDILHNSEEIKINDGFYVIEDKAYIVRNNSIVPISDRRSPHWEIELDEDESTGNIID